MKKILIDEDDVKLALEALEYDQRMSGHGFTGLIAALQKALLNSKPLTLREIGAVCGNFSDETVKVVRQTERHYGIKD